LTDQFSPSTKGVHSKNEFYAPASYGLTVSSGAKPLTSRWQTSSNCTWVLVERPTHKRVVFCRLVKSLYGLKQAPYEWNRAIDAQLHSRDFAPLNSDPGI
jgi:hypothetical protein